MDNAVQYPLNIDFDLAARGVDFIDHFPDNISFFFTN